MRKKSIPSARGMTLLETLVALVVFMVLLVVAFRLIEQASRAWKFASSKVEQFREARGGLGLIEARIKQATLNEYLGYEYDAAGFPENWGRRSELRFITGPSASIVGTTAAPNGTPTHAFFFTAPLGVTTDMNHKGLSGLLNVCGYYVEWSNKDADRPAILPPSQEYRFRLMQFLQPAEEMTLYAQTATDAPRFVFKPATDWQKEALKNSPAAIRPVADNVVAMIVEPVKSVEPGAASLTSDFIYDSASTSSDPALNQRNRLPPAVRITLYTIDETSAKKLSASATMPDLYGNLFTDPSKLHPNGGDAGDFARFEANLTAKKLHFNRKEIAIELVPRPWSTTKNL